MAIPKVPGLPDRVAALEEAIGLSRKKTVRERLREPRVFGSVLAVLTVLIAVVAWVQPQWKEHQDRDLNSRINEQIRDQLKDPIARITTMDTTLAEMNGRLTEISGLLRIEAEAQLKRISALPKHDFQNRLSEVKNVLSFARTEQASVSPETRGAIISKMLSVDQGQPGFWGAAAAVVSYRSRYDTKKLPPCSDATPITNLTPARVGPHEVGMDIISTEFQDCEFDFDGPTERKWLPEILKLSNFELTRCKVIYRGGKMILPGNPQTERYLIFHDCVFDISVPGVPAAPGNALIIALLSASDIGRVRLKV